jgi:hypothetical protein
MPLFVSGDGISTPLGKVIAAREIGPNQAEITKIDDARFERWLHKTEPVSPVQNDVSETDQTVAAKVTERIKSALAGHGVTLTMDRGQSSGGGVAVTIDRGSGQRETDAEPGAGRADAEIATQSNAPLVIKSSGPVTIDIGAIISNSND